LRVGFVVAFSVKNREVLPVKSAINFLAMVLLLPGVLALVANASLKTHYYDTRPRMADDLYTAPCDSNGQVVYVTEAEEQQLNLLWFYGVRGFVVGFGLWIVSCGVNAFHLERYRNSGHEEYE
jgi:hypothetical protein